SVFCFHAGAGIRDRTVTGVQTCALAISLGRAGIRVGPPPGCPEPYPGLREGLREVLGRQPAGTASETWSADDPWPAAGEWIQGIGELAGVMRSRVTRRVSGARAAGPSGNSGARASRPAEAVH